MKAYLFALLIFVFIISIIFLLANYFESKNCQKSIEHLGLRIKELGDFKMLYCNLIDIINGIATKEQVKQIKDFLSKLYASGKFTISKFEYDLDLDFWTAVEILKLLTENNILKYKFAIRCPKCGLMLSEIDNTNDVKRITNCYECNEDVEISTDDVVGYYSLRNEG